MMLTIVTPVMMMVMLVMMLGMSFIIICLHEETPYLIKMKYLMKVFFLLIFLRNIIKRKV
jgi:hypothetical protein